LPFAFLLLTLMSDVSLLLKAYYEALYERIDANRQLLVVKAEVLLSQEITRAGYKAFDGDKFSAYLEAAVAFIDERIELYNPFGMQYLFDRSRAKEGFDLEMKLNWYDSRIEFDDLVEAARQKLDVMDDQSNLQDAAIELIKEQGAFPDRSIIASYQVAPALNKLPDYIVAQAIEQIL
jgi:hypothetical protein